MLTLTASSAYSGLTSVNGGTLQIGNGTSISGIAPLSTINVASGATLLYATTTALPIPNNVSGGGTWGFTGTTSSVFTLTGSNTSFTGTINVNSGVVSLSNASRPSGSASINVAGGGELRLTSGTCASNLTISGTGSGGNTGALMLTGSSFYSGNVVLSGNATISSTTATTIGGNISGPYQLTLAVPSPMTLSGSNS